MLVREIWVSRTTTSIQCGDCIQIGCSPMSVQSVLTPIVLGVMLRRVEISFIFLYFDHMYISFVLTGFVFLILVEMSTNFAQRSEAARLALEEAIRNSELNPTQAIERSSLVVDAVATSSEDTNLVLSPSILAGRFPQISKSFEKSKSKEHVPSAPKSKRTREESDNPTIVELFAHILPYF